MRSTSLLVLAALFRVAHADGALEEVSAGSVPQTSTSARSTWLADKIAGMWEPGEAWQIRIDLTGTRVSSTSDVLLATVGVEYDPDGHWMFRVVGGGSPSARSVSTTPVQLATTQENAQLQSDASSVSGTASAGYDTAGAGDLEMTALVIANATRFEAQQQITSVDTRDGQTMTAQQLRDFCATRPCATRLAGLLDPQSSTLDQVSIDAALSAQLYRTTDVGIDGTYYLYDKDPATLGSSVGVGRTTTGAAIGIAPLQYTVAPSLIHRFGALMTMASVSYGRYVDQEGTDLTATLRVQYKLKLGADRRLKVWAKLTGSRDRDQMNALSSSGSLALGTQFSW